LLCSASVCQPAPLGTVDEVAAVLTKAGVNAAAIKAAFDAAETETALDKACAEAGTRCIRLADVLRRNERCSSATTD